METSEGSIVLQLTLLIIGLYASARLTTYLFRIVPKPCLLFPPPWCFRRRVDRHHWTAGIPNAIWGLLFYSVTIFLLLTETIQFGQSRLQVIDFLAFCATAFTCYLVATQVFVIKEHCRLVCGFGIVCQWLFGTQVVSVKEKGEVDG